MRYSASNRHSLVIGILLAALSAGCLIAFTLLAGSAEYPTGRRVVAADPARVAGPVTLSSRADQSVDRDRRTQANRDSSDASDPIVLGIQVTNPRESAGNEDGGNKRADRDRKDRGDRKDAKDGDGDRKDRDGDSDGDSDGPSVARPGTDQPDTYDHDAPNGNAYGHDKKFIAPGLSAGKPSNGGPPAHATAAGHATNSASHTKSPGPPAHATANGHAKHKKK